MNVLVDLLGDGGVFCSRCTAPLVKADFEPIVHLGMEVVELGAEVIRGDTFLQSLIISLATRYDSISASDWDIPWSRWRYRIRQYHRST